MVQYWNGWFCLKLHCRVLGNNLTLSKVPMASKLPLALKILFMLRNSPIKVLFDIIKCKYSKAKTKVLKQASKISQLSCKLTFGI